ncbi:hypothetical protein [Agilicoccus flavus]|uniref:hypothetical protein n=1 Tax=Agilicoccus flavus TaxID=2775968 RepID=UPI001CF661D9|nr:hypothetical protein [Agilicoccus flavus]
MTAETTNAGQAGLIVKCPPGMFAVSGGFETSSGASASISRPVGGIPPTGWKYDWNGINAGTYRVYVGCTK